MERLKNVYEITAELTDGSEQKIRVFSHSHDNAAKKAKVTPHVGVRKEHTEINKIVVVKMLHQNVIY